MQATKPTVLLILDGFGYRKEKKYNAVAHANTPTIDRLLHTCPHTLLKASGTAVGLPSGYIGNSEVGHMTIGSGRIITQPITTLLNAIKDGSFFSNPALVSQLQSLAQTDAYLHLFGLLSDAGVHSHEKILYALLDAAVENGITRIAVHPFLDGRDTPPRSAETYLANLSNKLKQIDCGTISSIHGRFYAMDRDENWKRTYQSYQTVTESQPIQFSDWQQALRYYYSQDITDEFIPPTPLEPHTIIQPHDGCVFFNIRSDRARQLTQAFVDPHFDAFPTKKLPLRFFITPICYNDNLNTTVLYRKPSVHNTLKKELSDHKKTVFTIA